MGVFHTLCDMLSIIGKRFGDAGLKDILIESQIVAKASLNGVIEAKHSNRAVRSNKYVYEAVMRLTWNAFLKWVESNDCQRQKAVVQQLVEQIGACMQYGTKDFLSPCSHVTYCCSI